MMQDIGQTTSRTIDAQRNALAEIITARQYARHPDLSERYGAAGREKCLEDARYHLTYLSEAIAAAQPSLFSEYVAWAKVLLAGRGIPSEDLAGTLEFTRDALREVLSEEMCEVACPYVERELAQLPQMASVTASFVEDGAPLSELVKDYLAALLRGDRYTASRLVMESVDSGVDVKDIYLHVFQRSQHEIGRLWQINQLSTAQEHFCTAATQLIMSQLYPRIFSSEKTGRRLIATCVSGDLHEIGVRMISDFFEMEGWDTFYLGANTPTRSIVQMLCERKADVLAASATMTFHVRAVAELIQAVRAEESCRNVRIMVGGYPFNIAPDLWRRVGADAYARDASESVEVANRLVNQGERP